MGTDCFPLVSTACVIVGGPLKLLRRCAKKTKSVCVTAVAAGQTAVAVASPRASVMKRPAGRALHRSRQSSRTPAARRQERLKAKLKQQYKATSDITPLLLEIQRRDDTIAALREELAAADARCAVASASNWKEGVAFGRKGLGTPPTPNRFGRARDLECN